MEDYTLIWKIEEFLVSEGGRVFLGIIYVSKAIILGLALFVFWFNIIINSNDNIL